METNGPDGAVASGGRTRRFWSVLNSPVAVALVSGVAIAGGAKVYADHVESVRERDARRGPLLSLIAEYQRRVQELSAVDGELDRFIGDGIPKDDAEARLRTAAQRADFERASKDVGRRERDILRGRGTYVPTSPEFADVDLLLLAARMEETAGIPDLEVGSVRMLGFLGAHPDVLWVFVRAYGDTLSQVGVTRHLLYVEGAIPVGRGDRLSARHEAMLMRPVPKPGDLERIRRQSNEASRRLDAKLAAAAARGR